jgi:hypothetical protein
MSSLLAALLFFCAAPAAAQEAYGAKGIYPVYETSGQWLIFDKDPRPARTGQSPPLGPGARFLVVGSSGSGLFTVARTSATYGGACRKNKPIKLRAALLRGPRAAVGTPVIGIKVKPEFSLRGSQARFTALRSEVDEGTYSRLGGAVKAAVAADVRSGAFRFALDDNPGAAPPSEVRPDDIQMKMDFGARVRIRGLEDAFALIEGSQVSATFRRCLRLSAADVLLGGCVEMPHALMAETALLRFVEYDPSGDGRPLLLAYTPDAPLWGAERWAFALRAAGPKLVLADAMDPRCREGF